MGKDDSERESIEQVAAETMAKIIAHMQAEIAQEDARREAERDARIAEVLKRFSEEGEYWKYLTDERHRQRASGPARTGQNP